MDSGIIAFEDFMAVVDDTREALGSTGTVEAFKTAMGRPVHVYRRARLPWLQSLERISPATWAREDADRIALLFHARRMVRRHEDGHPHVHCHEVNGRTFIVLEWLARGGGIAVRVVSHDVLPTKGGGHE